MEFVTAYTYKSSEGFKSLLPSRTVPNQAMSLTEIFNRSAAGKPVPTLKDLYFSGDEYFPVVESLDLVERQELFQEVSDRLSRLKEQALEEHEASKLAAKQADIDKWQELYDRVQKSTASAPEDARTA